ERSDVAEASGVERARRAHVGIETAVRFHGIPFDRLGVLRTRIGDRLLQQAECHAFAAEIARNEEAGHRPYPAIVDSWQTAIALKAGVALPRRDRAPADRFAVRVGQHAHRTTGADEALERQYAVIPGRARELRASHAPSHAGAIPEFSVLLGEAAQIFQPFSG